MYNLLKCLLSWSLSLWFIEILKEYSKREKQCHVTRRQEITNCDSWLEPKYEHVNVYYDVFLSTCVPFLVTAFHVFQQIRLVDLSPIQPVPIHTYRKIETLIHRQMHRFMSISEILWHLLWMYVVVVTSAAACRLWAYQYGWKLVWSPRWFQLGHWSCPTLSGPRVLLHQSEVHVLLGLSQCFLVGVMLTVLQNQYQKEQLGRYWVSICVDAAEMHEPPLRLQESNPGSSSATCGKALERHRLWPSHGRE